MPGVVVGRRGMKKSRAEVAKMKRKKINWAQAEE